MHSTHYFIIKWTIGALFDARVLFLVTNLNAHNWIHTRYNKKYNFQLNFKCKKSHLSPGSCLASMIVTHTWKSCDLRWSLNLCIGTRGLLSDDGKSCWFFTPSSTASSLSFSFSFSLSVDIMDCRLSALEMLSYCNDELPFRDGTSGPQMSSFKPISDLHLWWLFINLISFENWVEKFLTFLRPLFHCYHHVLSMNFSIDQSS